MPDKPAAQLVRELSVEVAESVAYVQAQGKFNEKSIDRLETTLLRTAESLRALENKLAAVEERVNEVKRVTDESGKRRFTLFQGIVCVVLGAILASFLQLAIAYFKSRFTGGP